MVVKYDEKFKLRVACTKVFEASKTSFLLAFKTNKITQQNFVAMQKKEENFSKTNNNFENLRSRRNVFTITHIVYPQNQSIQGKHLDFQKTKYI